MHVGNRCFNSSAVEYLDVQRESVTRWLVVCLTARQHRKVNLCQQQGTIFNNYSKRVYNYYINVCIKSFPCRLIGFWYQVKSWP